MYVLIDDGLIGLNLLDTLSQLFALITVFGLFSYLNDRPKNGPIVVNIVSVNGKKDDLLSALREMQGILGVV